MTYDYDFEYRYETLPSSVNDEAVIAFLLVLLGVFAVILLFALVFWIIRALSLYAIAKRRGISKAWLSWVPIGNMWVLGSLSDQYQHLALGQVKSRRKILLVLQFVSVAVSLVTIPMSVMQLMAEMNGGEADLIALAGAVPGLVNGIVGIVTLIFYHICNYDLYRSCDPKNAVVYLVIGVLIPVTEPFFYLANRKKDEGMPRPVMNDE